MDYLFKGGGRRAATGLVAMGLGAVVVIGGLSGPAGANGGPGHDGEDEPESHYVEGTAECTESLGDQQEYTVEADTGDDVPDDGHYEDRDTGYEFDIDITEHDGHAFLSFESNQPVDRLYIDAGRGCLVYEFPEGVHEGSDLPSPDDSISHVGFGCGRDEDHTSTTVTPTSETPPPEGTPPPDESTDTTVPDTSTTEAPSTETTTTMPAQGTVTSTSTTSATMPAGGTLPFTGSNTGLTLAVGGGLLAAGVALVATSRIRRNREGLV